MALNFSLKLPGKKIRSNVVKNSNIIEKNVEGVILEQNDNYVVLFNNTFYKIHPDSFKTKGIRKVYAKDSCGHWLVYDRLNKDDRYQMPPAYIPFKPKMLCRGDVVIKDNIEIFKIKVSWTATNINEYEESMKKLEDDNES